MISNATLSRLESPNLILRELREHDARDLANFMTQARYQRFISHKLKNESEVQAFVARQVSVQGDAHRNVFHLAAEEKHSREVVGDGFLIMHQDKAVEIGWGLHPALWRVGFGKEIGAGLVSLAVERLRAERVWCKVMRPNVASGLLAKRIGMKLQETRENYPVGQGRFEVVDIYSLTATDYFEMAY